MTTSGPSFDAATALKWGLVCGKVTQTILEEMKLACRHFYGRFRDTSDPAVVGSIPGPGVIRYLGQLSLPSLRGG